MSGVMRSRTAKGFAAGAFAAFHKPQKDRVKQEIPPQDRAVTLEKRAARKKARKK